MIGSYEYELNKNEIVCLMTKSRLNAKNVHRVCLVLVKL